MAAAEYRVLLASDENRNIHIVNIHRFTAKQSNEATTDGTRLTHRAAYFPLCWANLFIDSTMNFIWLFVGCATRARVCVAHDDVDKVRVCVCVAKQSIGLYSDSVNHLRDCEMANCDNIQWNCRPGSNRNAV